MHELFLDHVAEEEGTYIVQNNNPSTYNNHVREWVYNWGEKKKGKKENENQLQTKRKKKVVRIKGFPA